MPSRIQSSPEPTSARGRGPQRCQGYCVLHLAYCQGRDGPGRALPHDSIMQEMFCADTTLSSPSEFHAPDTMEMPPLTRLSEDAENMAFWKKTCQKRMTTNWNKLLCASAHCCWSTLVHCKCFATSWCRMSLSNSTTPLVDKWALVLLLCSLWLAASSMKTCWIVTDPQCTSRINAKNQMWCFLAGRVSIYL